MIQALLPNDLIDEFYLCVNPVLLGKGKPLFKKMEKKIKFELVESKVFEKGVVVLHYKKE